MLVKKALFPVMLMLLLGALALPATAHAQEASGGTVIVQFDNHATVVRTVDFTPPISGMAVLELTGLEVVTATTSFGSAICSIEGVGCPADDCFCDDQQFWAYSAWTDSEGGDAAWQPYAMGAGTSAVEAGAIEGWRWGPFEGAQRPADGALAAQAALEWLSSAGETEALDDSVGAAVETLLALGANRESIRGTAHERIIAAHGAAEAARGPAESGKLAVATVAAEGCWPANAPRPADYYDATAGIYSAETGFHIWALLGALAQNEAIPDAAVGLVLARAQPSGGWEWSAGWGADTNTTALAVQALRAAGVPADDPAIQTAIAFFRRAQADDGGFVYDPAQAASGSDANSTAYAIQGLIAAGEDPADEAWRVDGVSPIDYLLSRQLPDGSFEWQPATGSNALATQQAVGALLGRTLPLNVDKSGSPRLCDSVRWPAWFEALMQIPLRGEE